MEILKNNTYICNIPKQNTMRKEFFPKTDRDYARERVIWNIIAAAFIMLCFFIYSLFTGTDFLSATKPKELVLEQKTKELAYTRKYILGEWFLIQTARFPQDGGWENWPYKEVWMQFTKDGRVNATHTWKHNKEYKVGRRYDFQGKVRGLNEVGICCL